MTIAVSRRGTSVHVDVMDGGQTGLPHWREATGEDEGGRGFQLVNEIAQRWGFLRERARTCVWSSSSPSLTEISGSGNQMEGVIRLPQP